MRLYFRVYAFGCGKITEHFPITSFPLLHPQIKQLMVTNTVAERSSKHGIKSTRDFL